MGTFSHISYEKHPCIQLIIRDITRRNRLEQEIIDHYHASEESLKRLDALYKISEHVNEPKSFKNITEKVLNFCLDLTGATSGLVSLKNFQNERFETAAIVMSDSQCKIGSPFPPTDHTLSTMALPSQTKPRIYTKKISPP